MSGQLAVLSWDDPASYTPAADSVGPSGSQPAPASAGQQAAPATQAAETATGEATEDADVIDPEFLAALPEDIRREVIDQQRRERRQRERARERQRQQAAAQQVRTTSTSAIYVEKPS